MFKSLKFSKPKTPGYGISKDFYLTVLCCGSPLPILSDVIHPTGADQAIEGFGVPLDPRLGKECLNYPMERGAYAFATKDRKTVLRSIVVSVDDAHFQPQAIVQQDELRESAEELKERIRCAKNLVQLCFEIHDPMVAPAMQFLLQIAAKLGTLSKGCIADPLSCRYALPEEVLHAAQIKSMYAPVHVSVHHRLAGGFVSCQTRGLAKFALPEIAVAQVSEVVAGAAEQLLMNVVQRQLDGSLVAVGDRIGTKAAQFRVHACSSGTWELIPEVGTTDEALSAWVASSSPN